MKPFARNLQKPPASFDRAAFRYDVNNGRFPDRKAFAPHIPTRLRTIIKKCIEPNPADRYGAALDVANALAGVEGKTLDWRLSEASGTRTWTKNESGTLSVLTVDQDGESTCYKTVGTGQSRRVSEGCKPSISPNELKTFLGAH